MRLAILIMAAGQASRFGACKQLAEYQGKPLLQHVIDSAKTLVDADRYVLSGAWHQEIQVALHQGRWQGAQLVFHKQWADGLGSSIAKGVSKIEQTVLVKPYDGILILLADQIAIRGEQLLQMSANLRDDNIVCAYYAGRRGVPALFSKKYFPMLQTLTGDKGAKALLYNKKANIIEYPMENAKLDIDTPEQLNDAD